MDNANATLIDTVIEGLQEFKQLIVSFNGCQPMIDGATDSEVDYLNRCAHVEANYGFANANILCQVAEVFAQTHSADQALRVIGAW